MFRNYWRRRSTRSSHDRGRLLCGTGRRWAKIEPSCISCVRCDHDRSLHLGNWQVALPARSAGGGGCSDQAAKLSRFRDGRRRTARLLGFVFSATAVCQQAKNCIIYIRAPRNGDTKKQLNLEVPCYQWFTTAFSCHFLVDTSVVSRYRIVAVHLRSPGTKPGPERGKAMKTQTNKGTAGQGHSVSTLSAHRGHNPRSLYHHQQRPTASAATYIERAGAIRAQARHRNPAAGSDAQTNFVSFTRNNAASFPLLHGLRTGARLL